MPADVGAEHVSGRPGEDEEQQRRDERFEAEEDRADEEARHRAERFSDVRVEAARQTGKEAGYREGDARGH